MTLYRDPTVTWAGMQVGGIRISHMSHIKEPVKLALASSNKKRVIHTIKPLADAPEPKQDIDISDVLEDLQQTALNGTDALQSAWKALKPAERKALKDELPTLKNIAQSIEPETEKE